MTGHIYVSQILLYENALQPPTSSTLSPQDKLTFLWSCVHAAKGFLANRYSDSSVFPAPHEQQTAELEYRLRNPKFICMSSTDFIYTFLTALKLIMLQLPGWDLDSVRRELQFGEFLDRQCCEMEAIASRRQAQFARTGRGAYPADGFVNLAKKMRCLSEQMVRFPFLSIWLLPVLSIYLLPARPPTKHNVSVRFINNEPHSAPS